MSNQLELAEQKVCAHVLAQYRNRWPPIVASARAAALADQQLVRGAHRRKLLTGAAEHRQCGDS